MINAKETVIKPFLEAKLSVVFCAINAMPDAAVRWISAPSNPLMNKALNVIKIMLVAGAVGFVFVFVFVFSRSGAQ